MPGGSCKAPNALRVQNYLQRRIFNELSLHLCNINLFLTPLGVWKRNRSIMGFSFFVAPLGALMALLFPEPLFSGFSLFLSRIFGYYVTHENL